MGWKGKGKGKKGRARLSYYITQRSWGSKVHERTSINTSNTQLYISLFPSLYFSVSPLSPPSSICVISFILLFSLSCKLSPRVCVCDARSSAQLHSFLFFLFSWPIFISWKSSLTALCVLAPLLVVWFYLFLHLSPLCLHSLPPQAKLGAVPAWQRCHKRAVFIRLMEWVNNIAPNPPHRPAPAAFARVAQAAITALVARCSASAAAAANNRLQLSSRTNNPSV